MTEMTIHETTAAFINHLRENGKKERTLYTYRKDLDLIEGYFGKAIRVFRMMLVWAKDAGLIDELPLPKSTPMGHSKQSEVTDAEQR
jgi:hypothetical protein